jgi:hypothetical protein
VSLRFVRPDAGKTTPHTPLGKIEEWTSYAYLMVVLYATLLYLLSAMLFPGKEHDGIDFEERFFATRRWYFDLLLLFLVIDLQDGLLKGTAHFWNLGVLGPRYLIVNANLAAAFVGGLVTAH